MADAAEIEAERQRRAAQGQSDDEQANGFGGAAGSIARQQVKENQSNRKSTEKINSQTNKSHEKIASAGNQSQERISTGSNQSREKINAEQLANQLAISSNEIGSRERISTAGNQSQEKISSAGNASRELISGNELASRERVAGLDRDAQLEQTREKLAQDRDQFNADFGLKGQQLGADILKTASTLKGPENYFQGAAYARGVQDSGLSPFITALRGGQAPSIGGGTATTGNPTPLTVGSLANSLVDQSGVVQGGQAPASGRSNDGPVYAGGTPATQFSEQAGSGAGAAPNGTGIVSTLPNVLNPRGAATDAYGRPLLNASDQANLGAISQTAQNGLANLPLGAKESMTKGELDAFNSGLSYLGRNPDDEWTAYQRSRPGQGSAMAA